MGLFFNRSNNTCKNNPDDDIDDFKSLFEIKALDDLDPWEEEEKEIFGESSKSSSDTAQQVQESSDASVDETGDDTSSAKVIESSHNETDDESSTDLSPQEEVVDVALPSSENTISKDELPVITHIDVAEKSIPAAIKPVQIPTNIGKSKETDSFQVSQSSGHIIKTGEKKVIVWNNKGVVLSRLGKYHEAIEAYDHALKIDPNYSSAWNNKGVVLSRLGKYQEAIDAFDRALLNHPAARS